MKILKDIKSFVKNPDIFVKDTKKYKYAFLYSAALKVLAIFCVFVKIYNPIYFSITSLSLLSLSFFIDYKIISNKEELMFLIVQKNVNNSPFKSSYFMGRVFATVLKTHFLDRIAGFALGMKRELIG